MMRVLVILAMVWQPLMLAAANGDLASVRAELERAEQDGEGSFGKDGGITATTEDGRNALMLAAAASASG